MTGHYLKSQNTSGPGSIGLFSKQAMLIVLMAVLGGCSSLSVEEADYKVLLEDEDFELRQYEAQVVAETTVDTTFDKAGTKAHDQLYDYISGSNRSSQNIEMTAPVAQEAEGEEIAMTAPVGQQRSNDSWTVSFMMPASDTMETLPEPTNPAVTLREIPARQVAAVRYSGFWSESKYRENRKELEAWMNENGFEATGKPIWARYNPPFTPWFLRRNEVLIPIAREGE